MILATFLSGLMLVAMGLLRLGQASRGSFVPYDETRLSNPQVVVYRITGAFFFGTASSIGSTATASDSHKVMIVDFSAVPFLDSTGAHVMEGLAHKAHRRGLRLFVTGASPEIRRALQLHRLVSPHIDYDADVDDALARCDEL